MAAASQPLMLSPAALVSSPAAALPGRGQLRGCLHIEQAVIPPDITCTDQLLRSQIEPMTGLCTTAAGQPHDSDAAYLRQGQAACSHACQGKLQLHHRDVLRITAHHLQCCPLCKSNTPACYECAVGTAAGCKMSMIQRNTYFSLNNA